MLTKKTIAAELNFYKKLERRLSADCSRLPKGRLYFKQEHGRKRPYVRINGKEKYLKRDSSLLSDILKRTEIMQALIYLQRNIRALGDLSECFRELDEIVPFYFDFSGRNPSKDDIERIAASWESRRKVQNLPVELFAEGKSKNPRKFKTSDGIYVKSKSELIIYEYLKLQGIPFLYENPTVINGKMLYPDFTILRPMDGRTIIWEHFGMMDLAWYRDNAQGKLLDYSCAGYWPFRNLITTFEFGDGDLDVSEIERILIMMEILNN